LKHAVLIQGLLVRAELAILCVNKVMPNWNSVLAKDTTPITIFKDFIGIVQ